MKSLGKIANINGHHTFASVVDGSESFALLEILGKSSGGILHITLDDSRMAQLAESIRFFSPSTEIVTFPAWDSIPYDRVSPNSAIISARMRSLSRLASSDNKGRIVITTVNAALQKVVAKDVIASSSLFIRAGDEMNRDRLSAFLVSNGYANSSVAMEAGEYALRGSIVDIVPPGYANGFRLDFMGEELESIRTFDPLTQISAENIREFALVPASEIKIDDASIKLFRSKYRELFGAVMASDPLYEAISAGRKYSGIENWLPLFYERLDTVFDYVPEAVITFSHLADEARTEREEMVLDSYRTRKESEKNLLKGTVPYHPISPEMLYISNSEWEKIISGRNRANLHPFSLPAQPGVVDFGYHKTRDYYAESKSDNQPALALLKKELNEKDKVIIACVSEGSRSRIKLMMDEYEIPHDDLDIFDLTKIKKGISSLSILGLESGFEANGILVISEQDIFGEKIFRSKSARRKKAENFISEASNLAVGELVVHKENGIGRFEGLETLVVSGQSHDCLKLIYAGGDRLFVPVENIDVITRYGSGDEHTELDRLGGLAWQQRTARIKKRIKLAAEELLKIAAERALKNADSFDVPGNEYEEFCARFPYTETEDQERAIADTIADLHSGKPMDRLVCGDVGFGKTEIALRAAYVVSHPKEGEEKGQVALITPTTLLARQHIQTFKKRFEGTGVVIRQLSRLVPAREAKEARQMIKEGKVDIIIGTHALLAKNIEFKNLALLIVDEEQKFGVVQKERLKKLKATTHVLTLTATPIPRTLQLSLSGIRDLSIIATPPVDRLAVRTYVMPFDAVIIREAILREFYRGGRVFYVCPRIKDMEEVEKKIKQLVPEVKIVSAHGQMPPSQLDEIMNKFYDGVFDVLLSTTIVESGLDIPTANTLIIHRADMYGLAQLYQLRGRVGRSKLRAYAYLTLPERHVPTEQAVKRLEVMHRLDSLGAGFSLASHDMDIRGFGNLLGDEQSGQVKEVGVELYQDMLKEAIENLRAEEKDEVVKSKDFTPQINIGTSVLIPESYIKDLSLRLGLYRRIGSLETEQEVEAMAAELVDRFGPIPNEVESLMAVVKIKQVCYRLGINKVDIGNKGAVIGFYKDKFSNPEALINLITKNPHDFKLRGDQKIIIQNKKWETPESRIKGIRESLTEIENLAA